MDSDLDILASEAVLSPGSTLSLSRSLSGRSLQLFIDTQLHRPAPPLYDTLSSAGKAVHVKGSQQLRYTENGEAAEAVTLT